MSPYNPCVYYKKVGNGKFVYLLFIDDMFIEYWDELEIRRLKLLLGSKIWYGHTKSDFRIEIKVDQVYKKFFLCQKKCIKKDAKTFWGWAC